MMGIVGMTQGEIAGAHAKQILAAKFAAKYPGQPCMFRSILGVCNPKNGSCKHCS
jgi:hypothetical protein